jgi:transposase
MTRRPRYACCGGEGAVVVAEAPERQMDGGMATEALIVHVLVSKFCDALPLYRQSRLLARACIVNRQIVARQGSRTPLSGEPLHGLKNRSAR